VLLDTPFALAFYELMSALFHAVWICNGAWRKGPGFEIGAGYWSWGPLSVPCHSWCCQLNVYNLHDLNIGPGAVVEIQILRGGVHVLE
jgi:hypothetical protein